VRNAEFWQTHVRSVTSHPAWLAALWAQVWAQEGSEDCAWENEMYREERMIGRMKENLSMFVAAGKMER